MGKPGLFTNGNYEPSYDPNRVARASKYLYYLAIPPLLYIAGRELFPLEVTSNTAIAQTLSKALLLLSGSVVGYIKNSDSCIEQGASIIGGNLLTTIAGSISPDNINPLVLSALYYGSLGDSAFNGPVRQMITGLLAFLGWNVMKKTADIIDKSH